MFALPGHRRSVRALAYSSAGLLASAGDDQAVRLWHPVRRELLSAHACRDAVLCLAFDALSTRLAAGGRAGSVLSLDPAAPAAALSVRSLDGPVCSVAYTADGRALLFALASQSYAGETGRLFCSQVSPALPPVRLAWPGEVESAAYSPGRDVFALAGLHRGVELWDVGRPRAEPFAWLPSRVRALAFSPGTGRRLACATGRAIAVFDLEGSPAAWCNGHRSHVLALAFSPDGCQLLSGGADRSVRLWDAVAGKQLAAWDWQLGAVYAVAFAPDGMTAAAGGHKPGVVVWDIDEA